MTLQVFQILMLVPAGVRSFSKFLVHLLAYDTVIEREFAVQMFRFAAVSGMDEIFPQTISSL